MIRIGLHTLLAGLLLFAGQTVSRAEATSGADFKEIYDLIRANASGISEAELNRAAVQGLLTSLSPRVSIVTNDATSSAPTEGALINKTSLFEDGIVYLRLSRVASGLAEELNRVYEQVNATNKLKGVVLDLRYTKGTDYAAAVSAADLFIVKAQPLLNWGNGVVSSREKTNAIQLPVVVLVNKQTAGSAEAFAAVLRAAGAGLVLGGETAGQATVAKRFPLKNGEELRIATAPVSLGDGSLISANGIKPDIDVTVNADEERAYYADAFYVVKKTNMLAGASGTNAASGTNGTRRARFNEAELVREHREGLDRDTGETRPRPIEAEIPLVSDPALARALDLLKGLAVVRQGRS